MKFYEKGKAEVTWLPPLLSWETDHSSRSALLSACAGRKVRRAENLPL